jgi:predicted RNA-binding protein
MCGESAFVLYYSEGHRHLEDVDHIKVKNGTVVLVDMKGVEKDIKGKIVSIDLVNRRIELK